MTTRSKIGKSLREGLDELRAALDARDSEPTPNLELLTPAERATFDRIEALAMAADEHGLDSVAALCTLTYEQLAELRALQRRACGLLADPSASRNPADFRDAEILRSINQAQGG